MILSHADISIYRVSLIGKSVIFLYHHISKFLKVIYSHDSVTA